MPIARFLAVCVSIVTQFWALSAEFEAGQTGDWGVSVSKLRLTDGSRFTPKSVCFGDGKFVAAGYAGLVSSATGTDWFEANLPQIPGERANPERVVYHKGRFLLFRSTGGCFPVSVDHRPATHPLKLSYAYGDILSSPDGKKWTSLGWVLGPSRPTFGIVGVHWNSVFTDGNRIYIALYSRFPESIIAGNRVPEISKVELRSFEKADDILDGLDKYWEPEAIFYGKDFELHGLAVGNGVAAVAGYEVGDRKVQLLSQPKVRRQYPLAATGFGDYVEGPWFAGESFFALSGVGFRQSEDGFQHGALQKEMLLTSTDGVTWSKQQPRVRMFLNKVIKTDPTPPLASGVFFGVGADPATMNMRNTCRAAFFVSKDGIDWASYTMSEVGNLNDVCAGNGVFVAAANLGMGNILHSGALVAIRRR